MKEDQYWKQLISNFKHGFILFKNKKILYRNKAVKQIFGSEDEILELKSIQFCQDQND